jgi:hypothetical protein
MKRLGLELSSKKQKLARQPTKESLEFLHRGAPLPAAAHTETNNKPYLSCCWSADQVRQKIIIQFFTHTTLCGK